MGVAPHSGVTAGLVTVAAVNYWWINMSSHIRRNLVLAIALLALLATACGSESTDVATEVATDAENAGSAVEAEADDEPVDEVTSEVAESIDEAEVASSTTAVPAATDDAADQAAVDEALVEPDVANEAQLVIPEAGPGLGAFAVKVFQSGELGLTPTEQGCIDGRLEAEIRKDRTDDFDALTLEEQAKAIEIMFDCAGGRFESEFLLEFDITEDMLALGLDEEFGSCIYRQLIRDDDDQPNAILAIAHVTADEPAPEETVDAGSRLFARCVDVSALLIESFEGDEAAASFMDFDCLRTEINEEAAADLFAASFRDPNGADPTSVANGFQAFRPCLRFGQLMADQFAPQAQFSAAEITCIDSAFATDEIFNAMLSGTDLPPSAVEGMIGCLEPATLQALNS